MKTLLRGLKTVMLAFTAILCGNAWANISETDIIRITAADIKAATWSDDGSATINGLTVNLNDNAKNEDGTISIISTAADGETAVEKGVTIDLPASMQGAKFTAIVKYSNYKRSTSAYTYVLGMKCSSDSDYGITDHNGTYRGFYSSSRHYSFGNNPSSKTSGYLMISYHNGSGTACYVGETPDGFVGGNTASVKWSGSTVRGVNIGGMRTAQPSDFLKPASMTIEEVVLVKGVYSQDAGSLDAIKSLRAFLPSLGVVTPETSAGTGNGVSTFNGDTFTVKIPASEELPAGSVVRVAKLVLGMNSSRDAAQMAKYVRIGSKTSALANGTGNQVTSNVHPTYNCLLQTYDFSAAKVDLVVGNEYPLVFLSDAKGTVMDGTRWYMRNGAESFLVQSKTSMGYRIYAKIDGDLLAKPENGIVVFDGVLPTTDECTAFKSADWKGTVWLKNIKASTVGATYWQMPINEYGNANSTIRLTGCEGYLYSVTVAPTIELIDEGTTPAWKFTAGGNNHKTVINKLTGNGTFQNAYNNNHCIKFVDVSAFEGSITADGKYVEIGAGDNCATQGKIVVDADKTLLVSERKTMTASAGVEVKGTLKGTGTIAGALTLADGATLDVTEGLVTVTGEVSSETGTVNVKLASSEVTDAIPVLKLASSSPMSVGTVLPCVINPTSNGEPVTAALKLMVGADGMTMVLAPAGEGAEIEVAVKESRKNLNNVNVNGFIYKLTGIGGVLATTLSVNETGVFELDPIKTPLKIAAKPTFAVGAKIKLASAYDDCTLGKFKLMTWVGDSLGLDAAALKALVDVGERAYTVEDVPAPAENAGMRQLILKIGDYDNDAKTIRIMPLGDSITDGTSYYANQYEANPNYRVPLMQKLAARGYKPVAKGLRECAFTQRYATDASGVAAPSEYRWHSGVSGARVRTASTGAARGLNGGWREAIETTLDAAGDIDIITFKIGTNDAGNNKDLVFAGWKDVVTRILNARPNVKIVCASILNMDGNGAWETSYNNLIAAEIAKTEAEGGFPAGRVFFVDLYNACPRSTEGITNFADGLHPNWIGHDRNSDAWLVGVEQAIASMTFPTATDTFEKNVKTGAENNVPEAYRTGYVKLATKALPKTAQGAAMQNTSASYDSTSEAATKTLSRVAYYVELKNKKTGHVRYVWTSMDAFGDKTLATVGLPTSYAKWGAVTNLRVVSNDSGIHTTEADATGISGRLQFTYGGVSFGAQSGAPAALIAKWDWNDTISGSEAAPVGAYGTMQVYRVFDNPETDHNVAETLFAFNRWSSTVGETTEIGIGNFAMHGAYTGGDTSNGSINYMFTSGYETVDASAYEVMNLEIWGVPEEAGIKDWSDIKDNKDVVSVIEGVSSTEVTAEELKMWAEAYGVTFPADGTVPVNALILNCAPTAEILADPEAAADEILKGIADDVESLVKNGLSTEALADLSEKYPMATFALATVDNLPDAADGSAKFRRLKITLK